MFVVPPLGGPGGGPQYHFRKFSGSDIGAVGRFAGTTTLRKNSAGSAPAIRRLPNRPFFLTEGQRLHSNEPAGPKDLARRSFEKGRSQAGAWERTKRTGSCERPSVIFAYLCRRVGRSVVASGYCRLTGNLASGSNSELPFF